MILPSVLSLQTCRAGVQNLNPSNQIKNRRRDHFIARDFKALTNEDEKQPFLISIIVTTSKVLPAVQFFGVQ